MTTSREKFFYTRTLCCLLKALEGVETEIELRNESVVIGTIESVNSAMDVTMRNCELIVAGSSKKLHKLYVQGRNVRMVHVPDDINMINAMQGVIDKFNAPALGRDEFKKCSRGRGRGRGMSFRGNRGQGRGEGRARGRARGGFSQSTSDVGVAGRGQVHGYGRGLSTSGDDGNGQACGWGRGSSNTSSSTSSDAGRGRVYGRGRGQVYGRGRGQVNRPGRGSSGDANRRGQVYERGSDPGIGGDTGTGRGQVFGQGIGFPVSVSGDIGRGEVLGYGKSSAVGSMLRPDYMLQTPADHLQSQALPQVPNPTLSSRETESSVSWTDLRQKIQGNKHHSPVQEGSSVRHWDKPRMKRGSPSSSRDSWDSSSDSESESGKSHRSRRYSPRSPMFEQAMASSSGSTISRGERKSVRDSSELRRYEYDKDDYPIPRHLSGHRLASPLRETKHFHSSRTESSEHRDSGRHGHEKYHGKTDSRSRTHDSRSGNRVSPGPSGGVSSWSHSNRRNSPDRDESKSARDHSKARRRSSSGERKSSRRSSHERGQSGSSRSSHVGDGSASSRRKSPGRDESKPRK